MSLPPKLEQEIAKLQETLNTEVSEDAAFINLVFRNFPIGSGFNVAAADLFDSRSAILSGRRAGYVLDGPVVVLANGQEPQAANVREQHLGREWRRFSWHRSRWDNVRDNIFSYLEFVRHRLEQKQ